MSIERIEVDLDSVIKKAFEEIFLDNKEVIVDKVKEGIIKAIEEKKTGQSDKDLTNKVLETTLEVSINNEVKSLITNILDGFEKYLSDAYVNKHDRASIIMRLKDLLNKSSENKLSEYKYTELISTVDLIEKKILDKLNCSLDIRNVVFEYYKYIYPIITKLKKLNFYLMLFEFRVDSEGKWKKSIDELSMDTVLRIMEYSRQLTWYHGNIFDKIEASVGLMTYLSDGIFDIGKSITNKTDSNEVIDLTIKVSNIFIEILNNLSLQLPSYTGNENKEKVIRDAIVDTTLASEAFGAVMWYLKENI